MRRDVVPLRQTADEAALVLLRRHVLSSFGEVVTRLGDAGEVLLQSLTVAHADLSEDLLQLLTAGMRSALVRSGQAAPRFGSSAGTADQMLLSTSNVESNQEVGQPVALTLFGGPRRSCSGRGIFDDVEQVVLGEQVHDVLLPRVVIEFIELLYLT